MIRTREFAFSDRLLDWSATLPWWLDSLAAVLMFVLLHLLSQGAQQTALYPDPQEWLSHFVFYGRFAVPAVFMVMAAASVWRRRQRARLLQRTATSTSADVLDSLNRLDFKLLVAEAFRRQGYEVDDMGAGTLDEDMDLVLWKNDRKSLVHCKPWPSYRVGVEVVRELTGIMHAVGAHRAFLVTSGHFTRAARQFSVGQPITLLDGPALRQLISKAESEPAQPKVGPTVPQPGKTGLLAVRHGEIQPPLEASALLALAQAREAVIPACPRCGKTMQRQAARTGTQSGQSFWGCTAFPNCRGVRDLPQQASL